MISKNHGQVYAKKDDTINKFMTIKSEYHKISTIIRTILT